MLQDRKRLIRKLFKRIENRRAYAYLARQRLKCLEAFRESGAA